MRYLYCHGFGSNLSASKSVFFREKFASVGLQLEVLQLVDGEMVNTSASAQLSVIEEAAAGEVVTLIGSSFGGYLAALYAATHPEVDQLFLLAPALDFPDRWIRNLGESGIDRWRKTGFHTVHYPEKMTSDVLGYGFLEDAFKYRAFPDFQQPAQIFHGRNDTVVALETSRVFAATHPHAILRELPAGHGLMESLEVIWETIYSCLSKDG